LSDSQISPITQNTLENTKKAFFWNPDTSVLSDHDSSDEHSENLPSGSPSGVEGNFETANDSFCLSYNPNMSVDSNQNSVCQFTDSERTETCSEESDEFDDWLEFLPPSSSLSHSDDSQIQIPAQPTQKSRYRPKSQFFACQKPKAVQAGKDSLAQTDGNLNQNLTKVLEQMEQLEKNSGDHWRSYAYRKAIAALKRHPRKITSAEEAQKVRGIGDKIAKKITEILQTGGLRRLDITDQRTQAFQLFSQIWGAGPETIKKWIAQGYRSLEDLTANPKSLNKQQQIGVRYYSVG
jgi:hypothetical protein